MRQYLYFCTSSCASICTFVLCLVPLHLWVLNRRLEMRKLSRGIAAGADRAFTCGLLLIQPDTLHADHMRAWRNEREDGKASAIVAFYVVVLAVDDGTHAGTPADACAPPNASVFVLLH